MKFFQLQENFSILKIAPPLDNISRRLKITSAKMFTGLQLSNTERIFVCALDNNSFLREAVHRQHQQKPNNFKETFSSLCIDMSEEFRWALQNGDYDAASEHLLKVILFCYGLTMQVGFTFTNTEVF